MKKLMSLLALSLITSLLFTSCSKDEISDEVFIEDVSQTYPDADVNLEARSFNPNAQAIVLAAPSIYNDYYSSVFHDIVDFQVDYANKINGRDEVIILVDKHTRRFYQGRVPSYVLVEANIEDIWIRDFSPVVAGRQVKFNYLPDYLSRSDADFIDNSFENWFKKVGLQYGKKSNVIIDGGNVVGNGKGKIVVTERFLYDNPQFNKNQAKNKLKNLLNASHVAIIKEAPGDATGHSDGMLMWSDDNTIILHDQPGNVKSKIINELKNSFPGVKIVVAPDYYEFEEWQGFTSACNIYVNSLVTNEFIYVPTFNNPKDGQMLNFIRSYTSKTVVEVPAEKVCFMGGSLRCLTWQLDGQFADDILSE